VSDQPLDSIEKQVGKSARNFDAPPLHLWDPELSGDITIRIAADGSWFHEGGQIQRESLIRLFASIFRREEDQQYYLVTPTEKWRIEVELHPLVVVDVEQQLKDAESVLKLTLNTGKELLLGQEHSLFLESSLNNVAAVTLWHGLTALFNRAAWYRLVEMAEEVEGIPCVFSAGHQFPLVDL